MEQERRYGAVLFDMDGTLTDTEKYHQEAFRQAIVSCGYPIKEEITLYQRSLGKPYAKRLFLRWYGEDFPYQTLRARHNAFFEKIVEERGVELKPGAEELLRWLKAEGYRIGLATASSEKRAEQYLALTGVRPYFDCVFCAEKVKRGKPAPDLYTAACKAIGVPPERTVALEDAPNGILSAFTAGCDVIMVPDLTPPDEELRWRLLACVPSLDRVPGVLRGEGTD